MANKAFIMNLGKLVIGAAWADGTVQNEELNALKELLFLLPEISGEEWMELELYMVSPVSESERQMLLDRTLNGIRTSQDKQLVMDILQKLVAADNTITEAETAMLESIRKAIEGKQTGLLAHFTAPIRHAIKQRSSHYQGQQSREARIEDFIKNTVYFQLVSELKAQQHISHLPESQIRKVCLAAGLMARVAWVDNQFCQQEEATMIKALQQWGATTDEASMITRVAHARIIKGLDLIRLTSGFCECTAIDERKSFLRCLFAIANATQQTSNEEIEEIRAIARALGLSHQEFIDAKLTIPRSDRGGL